LWRNQPGIRGNRAVQRGTGIAYLLKTMTRPRFHRTAVLLLLAAAWLGAASPAAAQEPPPPVDRLCDSAYENCRQTLLNLIRAESVYIDVAFWFMEDKGFADALISAKNRGVSIRVLMDTKANTSYPLNKKRLAELKAAGLPMRERTADFLHWKLMLFGGQNVLEFSGANYSSEAFVASSPYANYVDEIIVFTRDTAVIDSFRSKFDDIWTRTSGYKNYANVTGPLTRRFDPFPIDPELNFPTTGGSGSGDFAARSVPRYNAETVGIDSIIYRIDDDRHTNALIAAIGRGVPVRVITEQLQYRDAKRYKHSFNVDRLFMEGVQVKFRGHTGMTHEKLTVLRGQQMSIFGSSNWTISSANSQLEHNYFTHKPDLHLWTIDHFERKWNNLGPLPETKPFVPLPPDTPVNKLPANVAQNQPLSVNLRWYGGPWAWYYDVYFGTDPTNLELLPERTDLPLGPSPNTSTNQNYPIGGLEPGTTYYWKVVSRTAAHLEKSGPIWSFRTEGILPAGSPGDVVLHAGAATTHFGNWASVVDASAASGRRIYNKNLGKTKPASALAAPVDYFEMTFIARAGVPYRLWVRGQAEKNSYNNDSVFVQFSDSVTATGTPSIRIGTTAGTSVTIEDQPSAGLSSWGWADNLVGGNAAPIYFETDGEHTIRVQRREDGISIDQIVLSRDAFLTTSPGFTKNDGTLLLASPGSID
jgi:phosphatidylserine/phosphatidylglycerophosphate/cardiolipin synthase-like enzyme